MAGRPKDPVKARLWRSAGQRLKAAWKASDISLRELAERADTHHSALSRAMAGRGGLGDSVRIRVADILGVRPQDIGSFEPDERRVPVYGEISAGPDGFTDDQVVDHQRLPEGWEFSGDLVWLRVRGESMIDVGILPNDLVLIRRQNSAHSGDIIAASVDEHAMLKRYEVREGRIFLVSENKGFKEIEVTRETFRVHGEVIALMRVYERVHVGRR